MPWDNDEAREHVARTNALLGRLAELPDLAVREQVTDTIHALIALYGECLRRVMEHTDASSSAAIAADELAGHLLLVHDLHPDPAPTRIRKALQELSDTGEAELISTDGSVVRVRVRAKGCGSSIDSLKEAAHNAVTWAAPETQQVELEEDDKAKPPETLIPVEDLFRPGAVAESR